MRSLWEWTGFQSDSFHREVYINWILSSTLFTEQPEVVDNIKTNVQCSHGKCQIFCVDIKFAWGTLTSVFNLIGTLFLDSSEVILTISDQQSSDSYLVKNKKQSYYVFGINVEM